MRELEYDLRNCIVLYCFIVLSTINLFNITLFVRHIEMKKMYKKCILYYVCKTIKFSQMSEVRVKVRQGVIDYADLLHSD